MKFPCGDSLSLQDSTHSLRGILIRDSPPFRESLRDSSHPLRGILTRDSPHFRESLRDFPTRTIINLLNSLGKSLRDFTLRESLRDSTLGNIYIFFNFFLFNFFYFIFLLLLIINY